ncbi:MAG TPA: amidohydrolase family protein [Candidatus Binatia bacterium]|nr:amidohydrolase family protein [Candidatus Binatia bacterium]
MIRASVVAVLVLAACAHEPALVSRPANGARSLVVRNVRVFDAPHAALLPGDHDVVVRDGRIAAIAEPGVAAAGLTQVDGRGATLLPGLVDVHTHVGSSPNPPGKVGALPDAQANLAAFLYAGVTTVLDLGNLSPAVFRERDRVTSGAELGPRLYAAGPVFTAPGGHPAEVLRAWLPWYLRWYVLPRATREVATPADARAAVTALLPEHPDILKLAIDGGATEDVPRLPVETISAITVAGHAAGVRSIAHVGSSAEAVDAVRGGVDALAHSPWRDELTDAAVAAIAAARVAVVPTLAIWDVSGEPRARPDDLLPIERAVARADVVAALFAPPAPTDPAIAAFMRAASAAHDARRRNVAKLHAAGVVLLAGSDACNPGQFPGAALHLELAKLVEAGLTPGEALRAATWENARFLGGDAADFGVVDVGKRADLVLVAGDPTTRIGDLGQIKAVVLDGTVLERRTQPGM